MVAIKNLPLMLRQAGCDLTEASAKKIVESFESNVISLDDFISVYEKMKDHSVTQEQLLEAFYAFDPEKTGKISTRMVRNILEKSGEPMTSEEVEACIAKMNPDPDGINDYRVFVKGLFTEAHK